MKPQMITKLNVKQYIVIITTIIALTITSLGIVSTQTANASPCNEIEVFSEEYFANANKSMSIAGQVLDEFRSNAVDNNGWSYSRYCDSFAGIFIDAQGILNIATAVSEFSAMALTNEDSPHCDTK